MAKNDYAAADRKTDSLEAGVKVQETVYETPDQENADEARNAGVLDAAFIDYDVALGNLEDRDDMESFASYTRRTTGVDGATFTAGEEMRAVPNISGGNGYANDPTNPVADEFAPDPDPAPEG